MATPATTTQSESKGERRTREVAVRVFAQEYRDATLKHKGAGEYSPTYVITPLGARINRLLTVGVLTSNETVGTSGDLHRAQITDPTGIMNAYAGQYQPEAAAALGELAPPALVAIVGKSRTYEPEPDVVYTSVQPETVSVVEVGDRDAWVIETARQTMARIRCMRDAVAMEVPTVQALMQKGHAEANADGAVKALAHYGPPDLQRYAAMVRDALESLLPGGASTVPPTPTPAPAPAAGGEAAPDADAGDANADAAAEKERIEDEVQGFVTDLDDGKGAAWEDVLARAGEKGINEADVEEALNSLMDKGQVYEPVLGRLKKT